MEHLYDNPSTIPKRMLAKLLYGRDSVFARTPTAAQVAALTRQDVVNHLARWQRPDTAVLGVAGAIQRKLVHMHACCAHLQYMTSRLYFKPVSYSSLSRSTRERERVFLSRITRIVKGCVHM